MIVTGRTARLNRNVGNFLIIGRRISISSLPRLAGTMTHLKTMPWLYTVESEVSPINSYVSNVANFATFSRLHECVFDFET